MLPRLAPAEQRNVHNAAISRPRHELRRGIC